MTFIQVIELVSKIIGITLSGFTLLALLFKKPKAWVISYVQKVSASCTQEAMKPLVEQFDNQHKIINQILTSVDAIQKQNDEQSKSMEVMNATQQEVLCKIKINEEAVLDLLRYDFNRVYYMAKRDGFISAHDKENCCNMYKNYKDLKGNSYIDELYKELMTIPVKEFN